MAACTKYILACTKYILVCTKYIAVYIININNYIANIRTLFDIIVFYNKKIIIFIKNINYKQKRCMFVL